LNKRRTQAWGCPTKFRASVHRLTYPLPVMPQVYMNILTTTKCIIWNL